VHFCAERKYLVDYCRDQMMGDLLGGGYYFTIWGPRQSGKTWLMKQVKKEIENRFGGRFVIGTISMQGIVMEDETPDEAFLNKIPKVMLDGFDIDVDPPKSWEDWALLFHKNKGVFKRPVLVFIDEFDSLPGRIIDKWAGVFRDMYMNRKNYLLHGLCLIGVRAALGTESSRGLPFTMQKSLHVPNFTMEEVQELFHQYQEETGQEIAPEVIAGIFDVTRGQPGLASWFGELLTEKYPPAPGKGIDLKTWKHVYQRACNLEWNNMFLNLIKKARSHYRPQMLEIFARSDIPFALDSDWCSYLYLNGLIDTRDYVDNRGEDIQVCRFSCPFVQKRLYSILAQDIIGNFTPVLSLNPFDELEDVFEGEELNLHALISRYKDYLIRLRSRGFTPWREQYRRADLRLREVAGHFHLYVWLQNVIGKNCFITPEFPTGSGKVDIHLKCGEKSGLIETRIFISASEFRAAKHQAADYAIKSGLNAVTITLFMPVDEKEVLTKLSGEEIIRDVRVTVIAIGWVWQVQKSEDRAK
jgi:hypothetical protein